MERILLNPLMRLEGGPVENCLCPLYTVKNFTLMKYYILRALCGANKHHVSFPQLKKKSIAPRNSDMKRSGCKRGYLLFS